MNVPFIVQKIFGSLTWRIRVNDPILFLTFDDGPVPEVTPQVLDILKKFDVKATFFCIGDNVRKYPELYKRILEEGHATGNHTFHHLNGWKTDVREYVQDVDLCEEVMEKVDGPWSMVDRLSDKTESSKFPPRDSQPFSVDLREETLKEQTAAQRLTMDYGPWTIDHRPSTLPLFRPPYGRIKLSQIKQLKSRFSIIMWDVLSKDYDREISGEECFQNVRSSARKGSIIVFHDSVKAKERMLYALPKTIEYFLKRNFSFKAIN